MFRPALKVLLLLPEKVTAPLRVMSPVAAVTVNVFAPPSTVDKVKPGELTKVLSPKRVMGPVTEAAVAAELNKEPPEETPVPDTSNALGRVIPLRSSAALLATEMVAVPNAPLVTAPTDPTDATPTLTEPAAMVEPPE